MAVARSVPQEAHVLTAAQALCFGELLGCDVDPGDRASRPHLSRGREHVHAGAAAEVEHPLGLEQTRESEVVADARERVDRVRGQPGRSVG